MEVGHDKCGVIIFKEITLLLVEFMYGLSILWMKDAKWYAVQVSDTTMLNKDI